MIRLCDVTLRDGLQNFHKFIPTVSKFDIYKRLSLSGIPDIEIGSNVSSKLKQMADTKLLINMINHYHTIRPFLFKPNIKVLVPSISKYNDLLQTPGIDIVDTFSLITAATNEFTQRNMGTTIENSLNNIDNMLYSNSKKKHRIYISCCFGCPFTSNNKYILINNTINIINRYIDNPLVDEIIISDTIGNFDITILDDILKNIQDDKSRIGLHLHTPCDNVESLLLKTLSRGIKMYDISHSKLGGCPTIINNNLKPNMDSYKTILILKQLQLVSGYNIRNIAANEDYINNIINN
jgi:hydroxymethylglutaryl-CoA lyase